MNNIINTAPNVGAFLSEREKNICACLTGLFSRIVKHTTPYRNTENVEARAWEVLRRLLRGEELPTDDPDARTFKMYFDTYLRPWLMDGATLEEVKAAARAVPSFPVSFKKETRPAAPPAPTVTPTPALSGGKFSRPFHLSVAMGKSQNLKNTEYPDYVEIDSFSKLKDITKYDHCAPKMKDNKRGNGSFLYADVLVFDVDNTATDDAALWVNTENIEQALPDIEMYFIPSRHNMKAKDGKTPRPKFHVYMPIKRKENESEYTAGLQNIINVVNGVKFHREVFDIACKDATRMWFGTGEGN